MWSSETKLSCIKTELKRCTMTESLWNRCDISRKSTEVKRLPKVVRKDRELALLLLLLLFGHKHKAVGTNTEVRRK